MSLSVIVVAYNSRPYLARCLDSVLAQLRPDDELIVVDNGSTDGGAELVGDAYSQARLERGENTGYAGGNNRGAALARGETLVFLNPDTELRPGVLAALAAPLADAAVGMTTACIVYADDPERVNACGNTVHYAGLAYCRGAGRPRAELQAPAEVDAVSGAAFAMRRALFERLGGFDERFFMYVEDTELSWRARLAGHSCRYVPGAVVLHDYRPDYTPRKAFHLDRNRHLMLLKLVDGPTYLRLLPGLLLAELVTWGFLLLKGPRFWGVKPRVYAALWRGRRAITVSRRALTPLRARRAAPPARLTYRLEYGQLASRPLALLAAALLDPAFYVARGLLPGGHP